MINLPQIEVNISGKHVSVKAIQDGSVWPDRSEALEIQARQYLAKHPDFSRRDIMYYLLWLIRDQDFVIFEFGGNVWNYVQFIKEGENLIFDFPYGRLLGSRCHQIDRVERILRHYGIRRYISPLFPFSALTYDDYCNEHIVNLDVNFGNRRSALAIEIMLDIVSDIFRLPYDCPMKYILGTQRGM